MSSFKENEVIKLALPINAAYVSAARLTASSIANRLGFDIDEIEDIKAAVSEACAFIIEQPPKTKNTFKILFNMSEETLTINLIMDRPPNFEVKEDQMSLLMIRALMDVLEIETDVSDTIKITMIKNHKSNSFE